MTWLWHVAFIKALKRFVQIFVSWLIGHNLERFGINLDPIQLSASIWAGIELIRNYLKVKKGISWL